MDKVRIGDICTVVSGSTPKSNIEEYWNGDIKWITPAEITDDSYVISDTERHITEKAVEKTNLTLLPVGTVLLSSRAPIGKTAIVGAEMYCNQGFKNLICSERIYNKYLYFFLTSKVDYLNALGRGATFKEISKGIVEDVEIPLPSLDEQKKIAERFEAIQQLLNKRKQALLYLDNLAKSRFIEMFGEPNKMDRWQCCKVKDIADVTVGLVIKPTRFYTDDANNGIKAFRSLNVREMRVNDSDWVYFSKEGNEQNKKSQLQKGDVLIVRSGYPGTSCVVTDEYVGCNAIDIIIARPNQEKVNPYYLCAFNNFPHGMNQIQHGTGGAAQKHFNVGAYNDMVIAVPPMKLQNDFVEFMGQTDKSKLAVQQSIETLQTLKAKLMQDYFG